MSQPIFDILRHSTDRQRVVVAVERNGVAGSYLVVKGIKSYIWMRPRGRSYVITADKCNCPSSRGQCKHVIVLNGLKAAGMFPDEKWEKFTAKGVEVVRPAVKVIDRTHHTFPDLPAGVALGVGWYAKRGVSVAVVPADYNPPRGWAVTFDPETVAFGHRCAPHVVKV